MPTIMNMGSNIKCYDKIKITHSLTNCRLHASDLQCKAGSYQQAVTCHKVRDETDWFVALRASSQQISYHFQYGDIVVLNNTHGKKYLHLSNEFESQVTKQFEVSLCQHGNGEPHQLEDEWIIEPVDTSQDEYWRVGELIRIKNKLNSSYLCSHKRKIKENDDYEVYGLKSKTDINTSSPELKTKSSKQLGGAIESNDVWLVSEIEPFISSAAINQRSKIKQTEQAQQLNKLKTIIANIPRKQSKKVDEVAEILKLQNRRLEQLENQRLKIQQNRKKTSWFMRYICCCLKRGDGYVQLN